MPPRGIICASTAQAPRSAPPRNEENVMAELTTVYQVKGMTCGHCEGAVSSEISELSGVSSVKAVAATGEVTVTSAGPLDLEAVRAAVDEAGYELVGPAA
ncbi:heavy-metal-associated domain-containing protein [Streptomyces sp. NPDC054835]|uniref:heavy-metal-associated domain-containing protein n=2 Tax=unclassified Streptomyces TaxID=2593676 RepID=UPI003822D62D